MLGMCVQSASGFTPTISQAYTMLAPTLGSRAASILFGVALLASGQNSTLTGTLAGQVGPYSRARRIGYHA